MITEVELHDLLTKIGAPETPAPAPFEEEGVTDVTETHGTDEQASADFQPITSKVTRRNLFEHPDTHPIVLGLALLKKYGADWLSWESETLDIRVPRDFQVREISHLNLSKIQAVKALHLVDTYWQQWEVFLWCTMSFNGLFPDFEVMQVPTVAQCMISVDTANRIRTDVKWSSEVSSFLSVVFRHDGIFCTVPPLDFVSINSEDSVVDCSDVKNRWPLVRQSGKAPPQDSIENAQLGMLLSSYKYFREHQDLLRQQLPLVENV